MINITVSFYMIQAIYLFRNDVFLVKKYIFFQIGMKSEPKVS